MNEGGGGDSILIKQIVSFDKNQPLGHKGARS